MPWLWKPADAVAARIVRLLLSEEVAGSPVRCTYPLAPFQEDAVRRARAVLRRRGGVVIADEVGLGKTYVALALIDEALAGGSRVAVVVPSALRRTWRRLLARLNGAAPYLITQAHLSRGTHDPARLAEADLIVVDEAHGFRNPKTRRYRALAGRKPGSRVVLITATPVNNGVADLRALLSLFAADDAFRDLGIVSMRAALTDQGGDSEKVAEAARIAAAVVIRRGRTDISGRGMNTEKDGNGAESPRQSGSPRLRFPRRAAPEVVRYDDPCMRELVSAVADLELAPYRHAVHLRKRRGGSPDALVQLGLLKRMESGRAALRASLRRLQRLLVRFAEAAEAGHLLAPADPSPECDDGDVVQLVLEELVLLPAPPGVDLPGLAVSARRDLSRIARLMAMLPRGEDPKVEALHHWLGSRPAGSKAVVFSEFRDTAAAVHRALLPFHATGRVDGGGAWLGEARAGRRAVIERFAPVSNGADQPPARERVEVLVATDVLSEGLNLQDAGIVVLYDLPWNPVRLLQRIGRVDRLGSLHEVVRTVVFTPAAGLDELLSLTRRLREKLGAIEGVLGAADAGELLSALRSSGSDAVQRLPRSPPDPWERLRSIAAAAPDPPLDDCAKPILGIVSATHPHAWLVLASLEEGPPVLVRVEGDEVTAAGPEAASILEGALLRRPGGATRRASGSASDPAAVGALRDRGRLEESAAAAVERATVFFEALAARGSAPAVLTGRDPAARIAREIRRALDAFGTGEPEHVERADRVLAALSHPGDAATQERLKSVWDQEFKDNGTIRAARLEILLQRVETVLEAGAARAVPGRHESRTAARVLAVLGCPRPGGSHGHRGDHRGG